MLPNVKTWVDGQPFNAAEANRFEAGLSGAPWPHDPVVSGRSRVGSISYNSGQWISAIAGTVYFYPVWYGETFGLNAFGVHLRTAATAGGIARLGLYSTQASLWRPGTKAAEGQVTSDSAGWKSVSITAVNGLAAGWYWHAYLGTGGGNQDVFSIGDGPIYYDSPTLENAVRTDSSQTKALQLTGQSSLPASNPAVVPGADRAPVVGITFT